MKVVIPKEILHAEKRVAAVPETVQKLREKGFELVVQAGAGAGIFISDAEYERAGATIEKDVERLFAQADVILKVKQPIFNQAVGKHEADMMPRGSVLVTFLHPAAPDSHDMVRKLRDRGVTSFTMDGIPRISRAQTMDALTSMSTVTGYRSMLIAAQHLPRFVPMIGTAIGAVKPANVLVVGAGVVGLQAIATAKRLGAAVKAWDIREEARKAATSLGAKVAGFDVPRELAIAEGGYAKLLPGDWLKKEQEAIADVVADSDVVILSALVPGSLAPVIVTKAAVSRMRPGSVIVDVSIDQGGNCELTRAGEEIVEGAVTVSGLQNIPGRMAEHASWLYANNMFSYVDNLFKTVPGSPDFQDDVVQASLVTRGGKILFAPALEAMHELVNA
jgi:NAD(P) transhydrogenase subunit alpha